MQKLIKITKTHYIVVDNSEIRNGEWFYNTFNDNQAKIQQRKGNWKTCFNQHKITHSTEPLEQYYGAADGTIPFVYHKIKRLPLSEVEEAINGYSVEKMAKNEFPVDKYQQDWAFRRMGFVKGFKAHQELVKDKLFTVEDIADAFSKGSRFSSYPLSSMNRNQYLRTLLPKTEWLIEFDEQGKITLL